MADKIFEHDLEVVGLGFRVKADVRRVLAGKVAKAPNGIPVTIQREQENRHDVNAIQVRYGGTGPLGGKHIGYLRADSAAILAPLIDDNLLVFRKGYLLELHGEDGFKSGKVRLRFADKRHR